MGNRVDIPFIGGAYEQRSPITNTQKSINCFPVLDDKDIGKVISMYGTPGLKLYKLLAGFGPATAVDVTIAGTFTNIITGGTASASNELTGYEASKAADGNTTTRWASSDDNLLEYSARSGFPTKVVDSDTVPDGANDKIYAATGTGTAYVWSATESYYAVRVTGSYAGNKYSGNYVVDYPTFTISEETYWQYDFGEGNTYAFNKLKFKVYTDSYGQALKGITIKGSNNLTTWRTIRNAVLPASADGTVVEVSVPNVVAYRYLRVYFTSTYRTVNDNLISFYSIEAAVVDNVLNKDLQCDNLTVNNAVTLDTCGYAISVSETLTNNGTITDTVSGGNGGSGADGGLQPSVTSNDGASGSSGSDGNTAFRENGGDGGNGGASGGGGGDASVKGLGFGYTVKAPGGCGGAGGDGGRGGGRVIIFAYNLINNGTIHANGFAGQPGYAGYTGELVGCSGYYFWGEGLPIARYTAWQAGGGGGGGQGGNGGNGGTVSLYYVTRTVGTVQVTAGAGGAAGAAGSGVTSTSGGFAIGCPESTEGIGGTGATGAGDGGAGHGPHPFASSGGSSENGTAGDAGDSGDAGLATWTLLDYPEVVDSSEIRCLFSARGCLYAVMGSTVFTVESDGTVTNRGSLNSSTGNVSMAFNGTQILIVDGTAFGHYLDDSDSLYLITDTDFPVATSCTFMDGYFIVTSTDTGDMDEEIPGRIHISASYDASSWDALDYATAEGDPDRVLCCHHVSNNLWFFGEESTEVWYNSGNTDMPFVRISGALIDEGTAAASSVVLINDQFYWLTNKLEVVCNVGYQRKKVSTLHIDYLIQSLSTVSDAKAFQYRIDGHVFYVLTFPTEDITIVYDLSTDMWHEWSSFITSGVETYGRHRANCSVWFDNKWIVGDHTNGKLYEINMNTYMDDEDFIKRTRRTAIIRSNGARLFHNSMELMFEPGVGLPAGSAFGVDPEVSLSWSDDYCNTWSTARTRKLGTESQNTKRVIWNRLGQSRARVYELTTSEPVRFAMVGCVSNVESSYE